MEPQLRKLDVDLEAIADYASIHDEDPDSEYHTRGYVDTLTGAVHIVTTDALVFLDGEIEEEELTEWARADLPIATEILEDTERRFAVIEKTTPSEDFDVMERFAQQCDDLRVRDALLNALRGRRPFRAFRDTVHAWPDVREAWFGFRTLEQRRQVRDWLETLGVDAIDASAYRPGLLPPR